jgi:hypothetical protein
MLCFSDGGREILIEVGRQVQLTIEVKDFSYFTF